MSLGAFAQYVAHVKQVEAAYQDAVKNKQPFAWQTPAPVEASAVGRATNSSDTCGPIAGYKLASDCITCSTRVLNLRNLTRGHFFVFAALQSKSRADAIDIIQETVIDLVGNHEAGL